MYLWRFPWQHILAYKSNFLYHFGTFFHVIITPTVGDSMVYTVYMKKDIHPEMHPVLFRDTGAGVDFVGFSTVTSEEKEVVDGVERFVISVEISSASHPFYTGEENIIDTAGRVEKFKARAEKKVASGKRQREMHPVKDRVAKNVLLSEQKQRASSAKKGAEKTEAQQ